MDLSPFVKLAPGLKSFGGSLFEFESRKHNMDSCAHAQQDQDKCTDINFKSNLALVVSSHPVKFQVVDIKLQVRVLGSISQKDLAQT